MDLELHPPSTTAELLALTRGANTDARLQKLEATLRRRDAILAAVTTAASRFLATSDWDRDASDMLGMLGTAAEVSRVYLFEGYHDATGGLRRRLRHDWAAPGVVPRACDPALLDVPVRTAGLARWTPPQRSDVVQGPLASLPPSERAFFADIGQRSFAAVPIFVGDSWWGYLGFTDARDEREWSRAVLEALQAAAATLGAAIFRRRADDALREREAELAEAQAMAHVGSFVWDLTTGELHGSAELHRVYGLPPTARLTPQCLLERVHPDDADIVRRTIDDAMKTGKRFSNEHRIVRAANDVRLFHLEARFVASADGKPVRMIGIGQDITERRQAEAVAHQLVVEQAARAAAEAERRRADFLAEASRVLGSSFDYHTTLANLTRLAVPSLADFCTVDIRGVDGTVERVGVAHVDAAKERLIWELAQWAQRGAPLVPHLRRALFEGEPTLIPEVEDAMIAAHAIDEDHRQQIRSLTPASVVCVPLLSSGKVLGALVLYTSDSGRRYGEADLALAEELARRAALAVENARLFTEAEQATRARDQMLGVVAHDLRNPLGTILMASELLGDVLPDDTPARRQLTMMMRAADRMNHLIQDLLDVKRMEGGRLAVEPRPVAVDSLLGEAAEMLRPLAAASALELELDTPGGLPRVAADPLRVQQVLSNLVGNAIKFTPRGGRITMAAAPVDGEVRIAVADTGSGIPAEQLPHIFAQYWQGARADRRGIGLGLAIAKGIVEAHHGRIWVESTPGAGSRFYFTLPAVASDPLTAHRESV